MVKEAIRLTASENNAENAWIFSKVQRPLPKEITLQQAGVSVNYDTHPLKYDSKNVVDKDSKDVQSFKMPFLEAAEQFIDGLEIKKGGKKNAINAIVEFSENMYRHRISSNVIDSAQESANIEANTKYITVKTSNIVDETGKIDLENSLSQVNAFFDNTDSAEEAKKELRTLSKKILDNDEVSKKGGLGKGFIETARRNKTKFEFSFEPTKTEGLYTFHLATRIPIEFKEEETRDKLQKLLEPKELKIEKIRQEVQVKEEDVMRNIQN